MLCTLSRTISLYIHIVYCKDRQEVHKHYTCYLNIVGIKYIYRATSMHMKLSQLSSDMYTAQYMLNARYTGMHAYGIHCARLCN